MSSRRSFGLVRRLPSGRWQASYHHPRLGIRINGPGTFKTKADPQGFFVTTLPDSGWWGITALTHQSQRATLWVHVDEKK